MFLDVQMIVKKSTSDTIFLHRYKNFIRGLTMLVGILVVGTIGYLIIEKCRFLDALYMTVITITTVGYKEIIGISDGGRIFTIVLIFMGIGIVAYMLGVAAEAMVEFHMRSILGRRKLGLKIKKIKNHYIICGYGRIGRVISQELQYKQIPVLVIEQNPDVREDLEQNKIPYLINDATSEHVLLDAGIEKAKGLVAVASSDADNLFITMTARGMNPELYLLARADEEHARKKLLRAGANRVILPYNIGGQRMANTIIKPTVTDFLEVMVHDKSIDLEIEELVVGDHSGLKGTSLENSGIRQEMDVIIIGIRKKDGKMVFNPSSKNLIEPGETLIALGHSKDLERLSSMLSGK